MSISQKADFSLLCFSSIHNIASVPILQIPNTVVAAPAAAQEGGRQHTQGGFKFVRSVRRATNCSLTRD
eukprot:4801560-Amphidinium_carterae.1